MWDSFIAYAIVSTNSGGCASGGVLDNPLGNICDLQTLVDKILQIVVQIGLPILAVAVVYVGFLFVAARGSDDKLTEAKRALLTVGIGAAIVLGAFVISQAIQGTINSLK